MYKHRTVNGVLSLRLLINMAPPSKLNVLRLLEVLRVDYVEKTTTQLKAIDLFLAFVMAVGAAQFAYCILFGTFPFNAFLSGMFAAVGTFVFGGTRSVFFFFFFLVWHGRKRLIAPLRLSVILRMQLNLPDFSQVSKERAIADFVSGEVILFLFVFCFIG